MLILKRSTLFVHLSYANSIPNHIRANIGIERCINSSYKGLYTKLFLLCSVCFYFSADMLAC